jgi:hypothetical protein
MANSYPRLKFIFGARIPFSPDLTIWVDKGMRHKKPAAYIYVYTDLQEEKWLKNRRKQKPRTKGGG